MNQFEQINSTDKYQCVCGSVVKRTSRRTHLKSKRHNNRQHFLAIDQECSICMEDKKLFYKCNNCSNTHCKDCFKNLQIKKCPFCRQQIVNKDESNQQRRRDEQQRRRAERRQQRDDYVNREVRVVYESLQRLRQMDFDINTLGELISLIL